MNLMDMFRSLTNANAFAAPGAQGNFGDGLQGIGHDMMQWARYGQSQTPPWAGGMGQAVQPQVGTGQVGQAVPVPQVPNPGAVPAVAAFAPPRVPPVAGVLPGLPGLPGIAGTGNTPGHLPIAALPALSTLFRQR